MKEIPLSVKIVLAILFTVAISSFALYIYFAGNETVTIALPAVYSDESETAGWSFKVNGREISEAEEVNIRGGLEISVFEIPSGEQLDSFDIGSLVKKDDYVSWVHDHFHSYNPESGKVKEVHRIDITINHKRNISTNINNQ
ncbi:hypothetical protein MUP50_00370 [Patescibacteria group bacterium]|nr:hypothetical protein [Patescibacteria group bacterium]